MWKKIHVTSICLDSMMLGILRLLSAILRLNSSHCCTNTAILSGWASGLIQCRRCWREFGNSGEKRLLIQMSNDFVITFSWQKVRSNSHLFRYQIHFSLVRISFWQLIPDMSRSKLAKFYWESNINWNKRKMTKHL